MEGSVESLSNWGKSSAEAQQAQQWPGNGRAEEGSSAHRDSNHGSSTSNGDSASHMYLDLRPFMDQAPTIVRCVLPVVLACMHNR